MNAADYRKSCKAVGGGRKLSVLAHRIMLENNEAKATAMMEEYHQMRLAEEKEIAQMELEMAGWEMIEANHCR